MKYNLIFGGIENKDGASENTEGALRSFLEKEMEIPDVPGIEFQNVHRLGERRDGKERSIIARFTKFSDHERVRLTAADKLKNKPQFSIYQQYPREIDCKRNALLPKMKELKRPKRNFKLVYDKLYVDGEEYIPTPHREPPPPPNNQRQVEGQSGR